VSEPSGGRELNQGQWSQQKRGAWRRVMDALGGDDETERLAVWWCPPGGDDTMRVLRARGA